VNITKLAGTAKKILQNKAKKEENEAEINEIEKVKTNNETKIWFFEKINEVENLPGKLIRQNNKKHTSSMLGI
jgi:hypothetical protein